MQWTKIFFNVSPRYRCSNHQHWSLHNHTHPQTWNKCAHKDPTKEWRLQCLYNATVHCYLVPVLSLLIWFDWINLICQMQAKNKSSSPSNDEIVSLSVQGNPIALIMDVPKDQVYSRDLGSKLGLVPENRIWAQRQDFITKKRLWHQYKNLGSNPLGCP